MKVLRSGLWVLSLIFLSVAPALSFSDPAAGFRSSWPLDLHRTWIGPDYWSNPLQDWEIDKGRLVCLVADSNRNVALLAWEVTDQHGNLKLSVNLGGLNSDSNSRKQGWAGFRVGAKGRFGDYRDDALYGVGVDAGVTTSGSLFIGKADAPGTPASQKLASLLFGQGVRLQMEVTGGPPSGCRLALSAWSGAEQLARTEKDGFKTGDFRGLLALVADLKTKDRESRDLPSFWFADWEAGGTRITHHPDRRFGPILFGQHTLSKGILKLTAQMPPVSLAESQTVYLEIQDAKGVWKRLASEKIDPLARTATFKVRGWEDTRDVPYRLAYSLSLGSGRTEQRYFEGVVARDPVDKQEIVVAAFTGNNDLGFPNNEIVAHVLAHKPDLLFFSGDQIYEPVAGYGIQREPLEKSCLDYLRKWYVYGWEYREMLRRIPTISIPDDHDVYHGNLWGEEGKHAEPVSDGGPQHDSGGYIQPAEWVRMVERTQTSHLPDAYDPTPVQQGIGVYYTDLVYGGVSFAIIEDRKFKSAPRRFLPAEARVRNGWALNPQFNRPEQFDVEGAQLLGDRQISFLENWVKDWSHGVWMKVLLSQTIFSTVATLPASAASDEVVPRLRILPKGVYPEDDRPTRDMDSNGWPKRERDRALRVMRKGFAVHVAGDQHLGSTIQYGVEDWGDAAFALCVPSVSNYFPRRWFPAEGPVDYRPGSPMNLGRFFDGFGNRMTVHAVANPVFSGLEPAFLYDRAAGYGIARFNRDTREIAFANWPRQVDPRRPGAQPYDGWPVRFKQTDNYGRKPEAYLPTLEVAGAPDPVVQVIDDQTQEVVYTLRIQGNSFRPPVFKKGPYTIVIGEGEARETLRRVEPTAAEADRVIKVSLDGRRRSDE
ncbi:MAG: alkaline phosphatase D family protein [Acidobacteriota bacterium]